MRELVSIVYESVHEGVLCKCVREGVLCEEIRICDVLGVE